MTEDEPPLVVNATAGKAANVDADKVAGIFGLEGGLSWRNPVLGQWVHRRCRWRDRRREHRLLDLRGLGRRLAIAELGAFRQAAKGAMRSTTFHAERAGDFEVNVCAGAVAMTEAGVPIA